MSLPRATQLQLFAAELGHADLRDGGGDCEDPKHRDDGENAWFILHELRPLDALGPVGPRRCAACAWRYLHELDAATGGPEPGAVSPEP